MLWFRCCYRRWRVATQRVRRRRVIVVCCGLIATLEWIHRQATGLVWEWGDSTCRLVETITWGWVTCFYRSHLTTTILVRLLGCNSLWRKWWSVADLWDSINVRLYSIVWTRKVSITGTWIIRSAARLRSTHHGGSIDVWCVQGLLTSLFDWLHSLGKQDGNKNYNMKFQSLKVESLKY